MPSINLQDVADRAGVSRMTVSRALRNAPSISEATRQHVLRVASEMGYRPNPLVSALMANLQTARRRAQTRSIAFFTFKKHEEEWRQDSVQSRIFNGAQSRATELGWQLSAVWSTDPALAPGSLSRILKARGIEGIIVGGMPRNLNHIQLKWDDYAVVALGFSLLQPAFHRVASNHIQSMQMTMRILRRRGYRRIGLALLAQEDVRFGSLPVSTYLGCQAYFKAEEQLTPFLTRTRNDREGFLRWFDAQKPDVILTGYKTLAIFDWLADLGLRIPEEIGVAVLGPIPPSLGYTHVNRDFAHLGRSAVDLIIEQLHRNERGSPPNPHTLLLDTQWVEGNSVRPATAKILFNLPR